MNEATIATPEGRFTVDTTGPRHLEAGASRLRSRLAEQGVSEAAIGQYLSVLGKPAALEAALAWYRAAGSLTAVEVEAVTPPTLYVWGDRDATVGPSAARFTADFVTQLLLSHLGAQR